MAERLLTRHLDSVNETYLEHMGHAMGFAAAMAFGAIVCFVHALLPFLFERTGSDCIRRLHERMVVNRVSHRHLEDAPRDGLSEVQYRSSATRAK